MTNDEMLRAAVLAVMAFVAPVAGYYRYRSMNGEKLDRWQEGAFILFGLRLSGLPWFIGSVTWLIDARWMAWSSAPIPLWLRWFGIGLIACAGALLVWTFHNLGGNLTDTVVTRKSHTLVTAGPYRHVRHPFYLTIAIAMTGQGLIDGQLVPTTRGQPAVGVSRRANLD